MVSINPAIKSCGDLVAKTVNKMIKYKPSELEESIQPNCWKLLEGDESAMILDEELDVYECQFNGDRCASIDTDGMGYIVLSIEHLQGLIYLINMAEKKQNIYK